MAESALINDLLSHLNKEQKAAVTAPPGNMLVVAGAGTGKTRVLVSRVVWLLMQEQVKPRQILAVTFTNKAATEMRERIADSGVPELQLSGLWVGTFHSICARFLRAYSNQAGLQPNFLIMDTQAQEELVKKCLTPEQQKIIKEKKITCGRLASKISSLKEKGIRADKAAQIYDARSGFLEDDMRYALAVYPRYEQMCQELNCVDFSELLLRTVELFENNEALRELQHHRFRELLVDEFQDTNTLQYRLMRLLCGPQCHAFAVGDDDQSIYGWRGADFTNMTHFREDFSDVTLYKLVQNYRSTARILGAANALIGLNKERLTDKKLVAVNDKGARIAVHSFDNPEDEAAFIAATVANLIENKKVVPSRIAVLYRNNACARSLEQAFTNYGVLYRVYGGLRFFDRKEIQDAMAYIRLMLNPKDDLAFYRALAVPSHGIGPKKLEQLSLIAAERKCSMFEALTLAVEYGSRKEVTREIKALARAAGPFVAQIKRFADLQKDGMSSPELVQTVLEDSGLMDFYAALDKKENSLDNRRTQNLQELVENARALEEKEKASPTTDAEGKPLPPLLVFVSNATLLASTEMNASGTIEDNARNYVQLMTIHSAKGLEFEHVFLSDFERGILPSPWCVGKPHAEEEERRLAYVAITRAKSNLYICFPRSRFAYYYGGYVNTGSSPFLREISDVMRDQEKDMFKDSFTFNEHGDD